MLNEKINQDSIFEQNTVTKCSDVCIVEPGDQTQTIICENKKYNVFPTKTVKLPAIRSTIANFNWNELKKSHTDIFFDNDIIDNSAIGNYLKSRLNHLSLINSLIITLSVTCLITLLFVKFFCLQLTNCSLPDPAVGGCC